MKPLFKNTLVVLGAILAILFLAPIVAKLFDVVFKLVVK